MTKKSKKNQLKDFIIDTIERTLCTFAETLLGVIGASVTFAEVNWGLAFSAAGLAALVTILKCVIAKTKSGWSASLLD